MGFHEAKGKEDTTLKGQSGQRPKVGECQLSSAGTKELGFPGSVGKKRLERDVLPLTGGWGGGLHSRLRSLCFCLKAQGTMEVLSRTAVYPLQRMDYNRGD